MLTTQLKKLETTGKLVDGAIYNVSSSNGYNKDVIVMYSLCTNHGIYDKQSQQ